MWPLRGPNRVRYRLPLCYKLLQSRLTLCWLVPAGSNHSDAIIRLIWALWLAFRYHQAPLWSSAVILAVVFGTRRAAFQSLSSSGISMEHFSVLWLGAWHSVCLCVRVQVCVVCVSGGLLSEALQVHTRFQCFLADFRNKENHWAV